MTVPSTFEELLADGDAVPLDGWDFSWLDGRATEQRPSWGYQRAMGARVARASAVLDLETGGGEVLAGSTPVLAPLTVATESWPPNVDKATRLLHPLGMCSKPGTWQFSAGRVGGIVITISVLIAAAVFALLRFWPALGGH